MRWYLTIFYAFHATIGLKNKINIYKKGSRIPVAFLHEYASARDHLQEIIAD